MVDYIRDEYILADGTFDFASSRTGKQLQELIERPKKGLGLTFEDVQIRFAYRRLPDKDAQGKYKPITKSVGKKSFMALNKDITTVKPDLIIAMGATSALAINGRKGISGIPQQVSFKDGDTTFKTWVLTTYTFENLAVNNSLKKDFDAHIDLVKRYLKEGDKALQADHKKYPIVTDFEDIKMIFEELKSWGQDLDHPIAMDFETNTLSPSLQNVSNQNSEETRKIYPFLDDADTVSAHLSMLSISVKEGQGWTIPLDHPESPWDKTQKDYIYEKYLKIISDDRWVVGHNFRFDIQFNMTVQGLSQAKNCIDTLMMYYVGVSEERTSPRGLKALAYKYTNMGGYDSELDDYKKDIALNNKILWEEYQEENNPSYKKSDYVAPVNELDGGSFNYDWIPLKIIGEYAAGDTDADLRIYDALKKIIDTDSDWQKLIYNFYPKLYNALCRIESNGILVDHKKVPEYKEVFEKEHARLQDRIWKVPEVQDLIAWKRSQADRYIAEHSKPKDERDPEIERATKKYFGTLKDPYRNAVYSPTSGDDNKRIIFGYKQYMPPADKEYLTTAAQKKFNKIINPQDINYQDYSLSAKTTMPWLKENYPDDEFIKLYTQFVKVEKLLNTYVEKLPKKSDPKGFIHPGFLPYGTVTSRLSSTNPKLVA